MHSLTESSELKDFFDRALPEDESGHTLVMGELHTEAQHLDFLRENLSLLTERHNLRSIGLEMAPFMNVFLWAYRDGKLPVPKEKRAAYMEAIFTAYGDPQYCASSRAAAHLAMTALDDPHHLRIVAYDTRKSLDETKNECHVVLNTFNDIVGKEATDTQRRHVTVRQSLRENPPALDALTQTHAHYPKEEVYKIRYAWLLNEAQGLLDKHRPYMQRLMALERFSRDGIGAAIGSDALSAALFHAASAPEGNRIAITGCNHIVGVQSDRCQGVFDFHLEKIESSTLPPAKSVAKVLLTSPDALETYWYHEATKARLTSPPLLVFNPTDGSCLDSPLSRPRQNFQRAEDIYHDEHANPLLNKYVAAAAGEAKRRENGAWKKPPCHATAHGIG